MAQLITIKPHQRRISLEANFMNYETNDLLYGLLYYYATYDGDKLYLSTSYGLSFSHILEYNSDSLPLVDDVHDFTFLGTNIPLYAVDSSSLLNDYKLPPMSEEIVMIDSELYVMNESASTKYFFGKLIGGKWCYRTKLSDMLD